MGRQKGGRRILDQVTESLGPRLVRDAEVPVGVPVEDDGAIGVRQLGDLRRQAGLADPGLAAEKRNPTLSLARLFQTAKQYLSFRIASHETNCVGGGKR